MGTDATAGLAMWDWGVPWIIAESVEAARAAYHEDFDKLWGGDNTREHRMIDEETPRRMADDEPFTMHYEDEDLDGHSDLKRDTEKPCLGCGESKGPKKCGCVTVTLSASEWCALLGGGHVIREFQA